MSVFWRNLGIFVPPMPCSNAYSQALTENVTAIDATDWPLGVYVWKVYTSVGGPSAGSTILRETGKWVKE